MGVGLSFEFDWCLNFDVISKSKTNGHFIWRGNTVQWKLEYDYSQSLRFASIAAIFKIKSVHGDLIQAYTIINHIDDAIVQLKKNYTMSN